MTVDVSVVIVSWNSRDFLRACLRSLYDETRGTRLEVFVVDNASTDGSAEMVEREFPQVLLIANEDNLGFARANNQAIDRAVGRYVLLLNPDTEILDDAIGRTVGFMDEHPRAGLATCKVLNPDRTFQVCFGESFPGLWTLVTGGSSLGTALSSLLLRSRFFSDAGIDRETQDRVDRVDWIMGAFMLVRREVVAEVGALDPNLFMYGEEPDWCYRASRAGWEVWYAPVASIVHHGGQSTAQVDPARTTDWLLSTYFYFFRKHFGVVYAALCYATGVLASAAKAAVFATLRLLPLRGVRAEYVEGKLSQCRHSLRWYFGGNLRRVLRRRPALQADPGGETS